MDGGAILAQNRLDDPGADAATLRRGMAPTRGAAGVVASSSGPWFHGSERAEAEPAPVLPLWAAPDAAWICIEHKSFCGPKVRLDLRRIGWEVHWPREVVRRFRQDDTIRPYYPGYMFALAEGPQARWGELVGVVPNVTGVVGLREQGRPSHPPRGFVAWLIGRAGGAIDGLMLPPEDRALRRGFEKGELVTVTEGAFASFAGAVVEDVEKRVTVMLDLFGRKTPVALRRNQLARS